MQGITLAILAGGAGTRMGAPKIGLQIMSQSIVDYLTHRFAWEDPMMLVSTPGVDASGIARSYRLVCDSIAGRGPLQGLLTALEQAETDTVVVTTVDMPSIGREQLESVATQLMHRRDLLGVMCRRTINGVHQIEPFPCAFRRTAIGMIEEQLSKQRRSVQGLLNCDGIIALETNWSDETWTNLNTPSDLQSFVARVSNPCLPEHQQRTG